MRRRAARLAAGLAGAGRDRLEVERQLGEWGFHPAVAFAAALQAPVVMVVVVVVVVVVVDRRRFSRMADPAGGGTRTGVPPNGCVR